MSDGMMQVLIDKIRKEYPTLTNKRNGVDSFVYFVRNREILISVGRSSSESVAALTGEVTDIQHPDSGIAMMASGYNRSPNNVYFVPTSKTKSVEVERELKQIEKKIKSIVLSHYGIADKKSGGAYCSGMTTNKDVGNILKRFLYENLSAETIRELNEPKFSFTEVLDMVNEDGTAWHNIIKNQKSAQLACKLLGKN